MSMQANFDTLILDLDGTVYVDAKPITKGHEIKDSLIRQLENPVLWSKSILSMKDFGIE